MEFAVSHTTGSKIENLSMKTKMALAVSLLFVVFAATIAYFSIAYFEDKFKQSIASQQYALACTIAKSIDDKLIMPQKALIAASLFVPNDAPANVEKAQRFLDERVTLRSIFDNKIFLFDKEGTLIAESPFEPKRRGMSFAYREYYQNTIATGKPVISPPYISSLPHHQPVVMLTAPVFDDRGKLTSILGGGLMLMGTNLLSEVPQIKIGKTGYIYLATPDRTIIAHPDKSRIMNNASLPGKNKLFDKAVEGFDGSGETVNSQGIPMLASFKHLRTTNWILAVNFPLSEAYAPMYRTRQYLLGGISMGTVAMLVIAWLIMRRLTLPLETITRQVEAMGGNIWTLRVPDSGSTNEIDTLASAFKRLMERLQNQQVILQENEQKYRIVSDNTYDWEFWLSPEHRFLYSSPSCERITGVESAEFMANTDALLRIIHPDDRQKFIDHWQLIKRKHGLHALEFRIVRANDGAVRWISNLCHPVYDDDGKYLGTRGSNNDITERKIAEEQIAILNADLADHANMLETANRELEAFCYTVSHDLRSPLTNISLTCQVITQLWQDRLDEHCTGFIQDIAKTTERMDHLITSLLDFSRISRCNLDLKEVNLSELAQDIAAEHQINQPNRHVEFNIAEGITVNGDENLFRVVLVNLIGNAWKYTSKNETAIIEFGMTELDGKKVYYVRDNGVGFDMSQADKLFDAFQRLHTNEFEGHGIGLASVKRIIHRHGGRIWAEGEVGKGATFFFTLT